MTECLCQWTATNQPPNNRNAVNGAWVPATGAYFAGFEKSQVSPISWPDNIAFDPHGNL
ncbi:hypothetical protein ACWCXB_20185 [Streptomyces sp. NPDC001514]